MLNLNPNDVLAASALERMRDVSEPACTRFSVIPASARCSLAACCDGRGVVGTAGSFGERGRLIELGFPSRNSERPLGNRFASSAKARHLT